MARWGNCDFRDIQQLQKRLERLQTTDLDRFCRDASKELAARLLSLVIRATPVGMYPENSGKKGGTLRRGWTARTHEEAENGNSGGASKAREFANSLTVTKKGNSYSIEVINPVEYASYVEFGHRTPGGNGWVPGQYFLTLSEHQLERIAPGVLEKKLRAFLREVFDG